MAHQPDDRSDARPAPAGSPRAISPSEIQQKEFRVSRLNGYRMRDVDEFLDQLTASMSALLEENKRLRAQASAEPVVGSPDLDDVGRQADEIIQRARDEAARITAEARAGAGAGVAATPAQRAAVGAFLTHEKEFLQGLAALVQQHAVSVKSMARQARSGDAPASAEATVPARQASPTPARADAPVPEASDTPDADRTQAMPPAEEPIRLDEPMPASTRVGDRDEPEGDPSLKELFWGEEG